MFLLYLRIAAPVPSPSSVSLKYEILSHQATCHFWPVASQCLATGEPVRCSCMTCREA